MKSILIIEDEYHMRGNMAEILELAGYNVQTAENGKIGVETALISKPEAVICDIIMPVMDGYRVLEIFRQHPTLSDVPFIFLSARAESADICKGMELGADDFITKPFKSKDLIRVLDIHLNNPSKPPHHN